MGHRLATCPAFTRPSDTTAYASADVIGPVTTPASMTFGVDCNSGRIRSAVLIDGACVATKLDADLFIFDTDLTPDADNAAFTPTDAELATCIGTLTFAAASAKIGDATSGAGGNVITVATGDLPFATVNRKLYGVLIARSAYAPVSAQTFQIRLGIETT